ncbi:SIMPL domain-containing protein [Chloroflexota bacterium]
MKKKTLLLLSLILIALAVLSVGCDSLAPPSTTKTTAGGVVLSGQNTGIWVTGEGKVTAVPDVAVLSLGVETQASTVAAAQTQASTAMDAMMRELESNGTAKNDIQTQYFNIQQLTRWDNDKQEQIVIGYQVTNTITAKIREVANTGVIIDAVTRAGGDTTRINRISFTVDEPSAYNKEARQKAVTDAQEKAEQLADLGGVRLGKPMYINESGGYNPPPVIIRAEATVSAPAAPITPITPGEMEIQLMVQVVYSIE